MEQARVNADDLQAMLADSVSLNSLLRKLV